MHDPQEHLIETIRKSVIGSDRMVETPFGMRRVTYADYTASGRCLSFIEDFIRDEVMPLYANTHSETSSTGRQTGHLREEARAVIKRCVGGNDDDAVIFCGSGATAAINKILIILGLRIPTQLDERYQFTAQIPENERPVVFIGPFEHHSNELPWRESIADVITIDEDADGKLDLVQLEKELKRYHQRPLKIGSFSAASNVTGIGTDTRGTAALLHRYGALSFWDFAAAGPYVQIEMNMTDNLPEGDQVYKDAVFISPHKFVGGPGTPGLLVVKKKLLKNPVPSVPGGGTVAYVNCAEHCYLKDPEIREEGGTPNIIGSIRAGLVFRLKDAVGENYIRQREGALVQRAIKTWSNHPNIKILGNKDAWRLSILSFMVHYEGCQTHPYLHHNFVVTVLNDLLGIQARGGCSCAGPYGHRLLEIDLMRSRAYEREILQGTEGIKPGWIRVNFNYFISETVFQFILDAVVLIAEQGWKLLPYYIFSPKEGTWHHRDETSTHAVKLKNIVFREGRMQYRKRSLTDPEWALTEYLSEAKKILAEIPAVDPRHLVPHTFSADFETLRWFPVASDLDRRPTVDT